MHTADTLLLVFIFCALCWPLLFGLRNTRFHYSWLHCWVLGVMPYGVKLPKRSRHIPLEPEPRKRTRSEIIIKDLFRYKTF